MPQLRAAVIGAVIFLAGCSLIFPLAPADEVAQVDAGTCGDRGVCEPGAERVAPCGACGARAQICGEDCRWSDSDDCTGEGDCTPAQIGTEPCGNCGSRTRTCDEQCRWSAWSACASEGPCAPGDTEDSSCAACRSQVRTCGNDCQWGAWGQCSVGCDPGETREQICGRCGHATSTCGDDCLWGPPGMCQGEGPCLTGDEEREDCPDGRVERARICGGDCQWGDWGACPEPGCNPGATEYEGCGDCSSRFRTCSGDGTWGPFGDCLFVGECNPGDARICDCGGAQVVCTEECRWPCPCLCGIDHDGNPICEGDDAIDDRPDCAGYDPPCIQVHCGPGCILDSGGCIDCR